MLDFANDFGYFQIVGNTETTTSWWNIAISNNVGSVQPEVHTLPCALREERPFVLGSEVIYQVCVAIMLALTAEH